MTCSRKQQAENYRRDLLALLRFGTMRRRCQRKNNDLFAQVLHRNPQENSENLQAETVAYGAFGHEIKRKHNNHRKGMTMNKSLIIRSDDACLS